MKKESILKRSLKQSLVLSGVLGFIVMIILALYNSMDTGIERFAVMVLGVCLFIPTIPIICSFLFNFILNACRQPSIDSNNNHKSFNTNTKSKLNSNTEADKPKLKVVTTEGYQEFSNILKASVKNKLMNRQCILQLKCELNYRLGTHIEVYKNFEFKNDMHYIYTLSKSSVLTKDDYLYLTNFISNNLILPKEA